VVLQADLFPVRLDAGESKFASVRVLVSGGRAVAWQAQNGKVSKVAELADAEAKKLDQRRWEISSNGTTWVCVRNGSCGCGSPLRRLTTREAFG
jgi:hypothetical protein